MPKSTKYRDYTKFNKDSKGLSKSENIYKESIIKGRIAETLIEELFLSLNYGIFRYGMENTIPGIVGLLKGVNSEVASNIRKMPDFVIQHPENKSVYFIEVKFRASGEFDKNDQYFTKNGKSIIDYPYENAYFIVAITPKSKNFLSKRDELGLDRKTIINFCKFAVKFFECI